MQPAHAPMSLAYVMRVYGNDYCFARRMMRGLCYEEVLGIFVNDGNGSLSLFAHVRFSRRLIGSVIYFIHFFVVFRMMKWV